MNTNKRIRTVDEYLQKGCGRCEFFNTEFCKVNKWRKVLIEVRKIILQTGLKEELKWSQPCYTFDGKNILILAAFKNFVGLSFFKGVLLKDPKNLLVSPGENSQSVKYLKVTSISEIKKLKSTIINYIKEAIEIEKSGKKIEKKIELKIPEELKQKFIENPKLEKAFYKLTPGRQRAYIIYFSQPKKSETRLARIEKFIDKILNGKGFYD